MEAKAMTIHSMYQLAAEPVAVLTSASAAQVSTTPIRPILRGPIRSTAMPMWTLASACTSVESVRPEVVSVRDQPNSSLIGTIYGLMP